MQLALPPDSTLRALAQLVRVPPRRTSPYEQDDPPR